MTKKKKIPVIDWDKEEKVEINISTSKYPSLEDVYGNDEFKEGLEDIVLSMTNPLVYRIMGAKLPRSYLFYGPPGTGKSFSAQAISNELSKRVKPKEVVLLPYDIGKYGTAYINMGSRNLQMFFDSGLDILTNPQLPVHSVIYYFDECDALMSPRGGSNSHKEDDKLLETLMKNLQYIDERGDNEYVILATNFPDGLDKASIRSGRINHKLEFKLPDYEGRQKLFYGYISKVNKLASYKVIRNFNLGNLAEASEEFSCADIEAVIDKAMHYKIKTELRTKEPGVVKAYWIGEDYLLAAINKVRDEKIQGTKTIGFAK